MFVEKQLGNGCTWINLDVGKLKKLEDLSEIYGLTRKPSNTHWIEMSVPTWTTTVKRERSPSFIMFLI